MKALAVLTALALFGCAGASPSLEHVRIPLDAMGRAMTEHHGKIRAVCELVPPDACRKLVDSFNVLATAQNAAADGVEAIQSVTE